MNGSLKWGLMLLLAALLVAVLMGDEGSDIAGILGIVGVVALLIGVIRIPTRKG